MSTEDRKLFGLRLRYPFRYLQPAACAQRVGEHLDHEPDLFPRFVVLQVVLDVKDPKLTADRLSQKMAEQIDKYGDKCMPPKMFIIEKGPDGIIQPCDGEIEMKKIGWILIIASIIIQLSFLPAYGISWYAKMAVNERNVAEYIHKLKAGKDPDSLRRPALRRDARGEARRYVVELTKDMDEAERLARQGKRQQIKDLEFRYPLPQKTRH